MNCGVRSCVTHNALSSPPPIHPVHHLYYYYNRIGVGRTTTKRQLRSSAERKLRFRTTATEETYNMRAGRQAVSQAGRQLRQVGCRPNGQNYDDDDDDEE